MNILFLGLLYEKNQEERLLKLSKDGLQGAANTYQWNIIDGLEKNINKPIDIYNTLPVGTYPKYFDKLFIKSRNWEHKKGASNKEIGYINLPIIKQLDRIYKFKGSILNWLKSSNENRYIIIYSLYTPFLEVIKSIKKIYPDLRICIIVPDLPLHYGIMPSKKTLKYAISFFNGKKIFRSLNDIDMYVLLTEQMVNPLGIKGKQYTVIEGIASNYHFSLSHRADKKKIILYTGAVDKLLGISELLEAFKIIDKQNYELWICGKGDAEKQIEESSQEDSRIKYLGYVTKQQIYQLQSEATVLINPRADEDEFTKYSFPSKTMEYMLSGKPVLMNKLMGVPNEYDEYLIYFDEFTPLAVSNKIIEICEMNVEDRSAIGEKARNFIVNEKNGFKQAKKIINMLREQSNK